MGYVILLPVYAQSVKYVDTEILLYYIIAIL